MRMNQELPEPEAVPPESEKKQDSMLEMKLYRVGQVAKMFDVTNYTVRHWLNTEGPTGLRGIKIGTGLQGQWRITEQELIRFANIKFGSGLPRER